MECLQPASLLQGCCLDFGNRHKDTYQTLERNAGHERHARSQQGRLSKRTWWYHSTGESLPEHYHMKNLIAGDPQIDFQILNNEFAWTPGASFLDTVTSTQGLRNLFQRLAKTFEGSILQSPYLLVHEACIKAEFIEWSHNLDL